MLGVLYVVSTPIGNLEDITFRALDTLKNCDLILSEDTRETDKVLKKYQILTPQISYRDQNHARILPKILEFLHEGKNLALVSDSGTPLISDPGFKLVEALIAEGVRVTSVPGPSAVISSLTVSGMPTDKFIFLGFLPKTTGKREEMLKKYGSLDSTLIIYESPFRFKKLVSEIRKVLGNRKICVCNNLTKVHEFILRGNIDTIMPDILRVKEKGEFVVLVSKQDY